MGIEANIKLTEDDWLNICKTQCTTSSSGLWREFIWKNSLRFFITPNVRQSQNGKPEDRQCWRICGNISTGHAHIFWEYPHIASYWAAVVR